MYEYEHLGGWYIKSSIYKRLLQWNWILKTIREFLEKLRSFCKVNFLLPILFVLTLVFTRAVWYRNVAFSIIVLSSKKRHSSFLKKDLFFQKTCLKAKVIRTLKIPSDYRVKICRSLERKAILKVSLVPFF